MSKIHNRIILLCISFPVGLPELHNFSAGSSALLTRSGIIKTAEIWKKMPENRLIYRTQAIL